MSDSGDAIATAMTWMFAVTSYTVRLETISLVALQVSCTLVPWILGSSTFEKIYKLLVFIVMPSISVFIFLSNRHIVPQILWYGLLRGRDSSTDTFTLIHHLVQLAVTAGGRIFIHVKMNGEHPNHIIRLEIAALVVLQCLVLANLVHHT